MVIHIHKSCNMIRNLPLFNHMYNQLWPYMLLKMNLSSNKPLSYFSIVCYFLLIFCYSFLFHTLTVKKNISDKFIKLFSINHKNSPLTQALMSETLNCDFFQHLFYFPLIVYSNLPAYFNFSLSPFFLILKTN